MVTLAIIVVKWMEDGDEACNKPVNLGAFPTQDDAIVAIRAHMAPFADETTFADCTLFLEDGDKKEFDLDA